MKKKSKRNEQTLVISIFLYGKQFFFLRLIESATTVLVENRRAVSMQMLTVDLGGHKLTFAGKFFQICESKKIAKIYATYRQ